MGPGDATMRKWQFDKFSVFESANRVDIRTIDSVPMFFMLSELVAYQSLSILYKF